MAKPYYAILINYHGNNGEIVYSEIVDRCHKLSKAEDLLYEYQMGFRRCNSQYDNKNLNFPLYSIIAISEDIMYQFPNATEYLLIDNFRRLDKSNKNLVRWVINSLYGRGYEAINIDLDGNDENQLITMYRCLSHLKKKRLQELIKNTFNRTDDTLSITEEETNLLNEYRKLNASCKSLIQDNIKQLSLGSSNIGNALILEK